VSHGAWPKLRATVGRLLAAGPPGLALDGEMYAHGLAFEEVVSRFKRAAGGLQYHVFDLYDPARPDLDASDRQALLAQLFRAAVGDSGRGNVRRVPFEWARSEEEVLDMSRMYLAQGYEGLVARRRNGVYEPGKRSQNLLKLKPFRTDEFPIVGVVEASGKDSGSAVFVCTSSLSAHVQLTFRVRLRAPLERRRQLLLAYQRAPASILGKLLTVRYQSLTTKGVPRFPVGLAIRDYES
jgi:DNA ligase-1